ncbi:hypothetical protein G9A89_002883 [Geosiphon pyriformis]|nr:hypothetical protein G9A89_002883 [Geosiphon pyriformis]
MSVTISGSKHSAEWVHAQSENRHSAEWVHAQRLENTTFGDIKELETPCLVEFLRLRLGFFPVKDAPLPHSTLRARRDTSTPLPGLFYQLEAFNLGDLLWLSARLGTRMKLSWIFLVFFEFVSHE